MCTEKDPFEKKWPFEKNKTTEKSSFKQIPEGEQHDPTSGLVASCCSGK